MMQVSLSKCNCMAYGEFFFDLLKKLNRILRSCYLSQIFMLYIIVMVYYELSQEGLNNNVVAHTCTGQWAFPSIIPGIWSHPKLSKN
jgi:hypothetical protein